MTDDRALRILVADDQADVRESLRLLLKAEGFGVATAASPAEILAALEKRDCDAILMDLNYTRDTTSGNEGLGLLERIQAADGPPVVVMTAWGSVELAVEAMRRGACDFVQKPWHNERLLTTLRTQIDLWCARRHGNGLAEENHRWRGECDYEMIATAPIMQPVLELIERVGPSEANVLITGEHGTGKEITARRLHAISPRSERPMVIVNAGGLAEGVFESELFGHVRGAFTDAKTDRAGRFELAERGTLFLDEIANTPLGMQNKLLRVLETREYERVGSSKTLRADVRLMSATNSDLRAAAATGRFRQDLLYRLNTVEIHLPPLRERGKDIQLLAEHFLRRHARRYRKNLMEFDAAALRALMNHPWPGNIRELEHTVERAVLLAHGEAVQPEDLRLHMSDEASVFPDDARQEKLCLEETEAQIIRKALGRCGGNISQAAEILGLSRGALYRRMQKYGMVRE